MNDTKPTDAETAGTHATGILDGRVAIITGAAHGIGRAYARRLAREGAAVVVADIDEEGSVAVANELAAEGLRAVGTRVDVRDAAELDAMSAVAVEAFGRIDILINNAALFATVPMSRSPFDEIEIEEWDRMMAVNLRGAWLASRSVVPTMREQGYGKIVNISSGTALKGSSNRIHYVTSKAGIMGFTRTLAREVGPSGITVNCVAPGNTLSEDAPNADTLAMRTAGSFDRALPRVQVPEDLEGAIVFFSAPWSDFITGQTLVVDGGSFMH
jgi:NAD(P)-dependent dehydrogenase (short-subunit alcohol dehydrogenase family)